MPASAGTSCLGLRASNRHAKNADAWRQLTLNKDRFQRGKLKFMVTRQTWYVGVDPV